MNHRKTLSKAEVNDLKQRLVTNIKKPSKFTKTREELEAEQCSFKPDLQLTEKRNAKKRSEQQFLEDQREFKQEIEDRKQQK